MAPHEFTFIHVSPKRSSKRAQRLQSSKAKSHAAYSGYLARRLRKDHLVADTKRPTIGIKDVRDSVQHQESWNSTDENDEESVTKYGWQIPVLDQLRTSKCFPALSLQYEAFRGLRTDPFLHVPGSEAGDGALIDFFSHDIGPINESVAFVFNTTNIASGMLQILAQDKFYHTLLTILQSMNDQLHSAALSPSVGVLRRKGQAMAQVRKGLEEADATVDEAVLCAMVLLAVLEGRFQATTVRDVHKNTLAKITSRRGGLESFQDGSVFKASIMQFDTFWTWETGKTMFPGQRRQRDPTYPSNPSSMKLILALPVGFRDLYAEGALSYDLLPVLTRATYFAKLSAQQRMSFLLKTRNQKKPFNDFWEACPCLGLSDSKYHPLERLLTMSVMYFIYGTFEPRAFPTGPAGPTPDLTQKLMAYQTNTKAEEACLQWMWILNIDLLWGARPDPLDNYFSVFHLQRRYPHFRSLEAVLDFGPRFLWTREMTRSVQSYWKDVIISSLTVEDIAADLFS
ncbi:hypothetical protein H2200_006038 [Cladophialophora chaetospira]|uniref:Uncharacterized protein n=1 Tax=Cladophialophora chaetospira TaxID=386627 RepID=A0AA38XAE1_9EURO|nr:hypothetical protein H2200_006038 [Cladophialophora chaetospira]